MKKSLKLCVTILFVVLAFASIMPVFAVSTDFPTTGTPSANVKTAAGKAWGTVVTIVQILAFAAVVFAGLRYMFASADQKADIKKSMGILALGAILVFASATVVSFITSAGNQLLVVE